MRGDRRQWIRGPETGGDARGARRQEGRVLRCRPKARSLRGSYCGMPCSPFTWIPARIPNSDFPSTAGAWERKEIEYVQGDISDRDIVFKIIEGAQCVWHNAAAVGPYHPEEVYYKVDPHSHVRVWHVTILWFEGELRGNVERD